jgi:sigma-B regulation protein RsbU (phosphoserine phosphatase)
LALIAFLVVLILALNWLRSPFLGGLVGVDHRFVNYIPMNSEPWEAYTSGLGSDDRLLSIGDTDLSLASDLQDGLRKFQFGERVSLNVRSDNGELNEYRITLQRWSSLDQFTLFVLPYLLGLTFLGSGMWVLRLRRRDAAGQAFAIFSTSVAIVLGAFFDLFTTQRLVGLWTLALGMTGGALFHMGLVFPEELENYGRNPLLRWLGYVPALILALLAILALPDAPVSSGHRIAWRYQVILVGLGGLFYLGWLISRRYTSKSPIARTQARTILWGSLISLGPIAVWFLVKILQPNTPFIPFVLIPLGVFPLVNTYALLRYRLLNTDYILSRTALYALLTIFAAVGYALLVGGLSLALGIPMATANPIVIGFLVVALALLLNPLRDRLQKAIDQVFFHGRSAYEDQLKAFSHALTQAVELPKIHRVLRRFIKAPLLPTQLHVFIHDSASDQYVAAADDTGRPTSDLRFPASSALAQSLMRRQSAFFLERSTTLPRALYDDWARMSLLGAQFFIPMPGQNHLVGWIALGPRKSGEPYTDKDLAYLEALGDQAALALERAQVVVDLEQRVHQMNVLTRVAQGVNVTSVYDDLLELLYAQTNQVIPTNDFFITLFDEPHKRQPTHSSWKRTKGSAKKKVYFWESGRDSHPLSSRLDAQSSPMTTPASAGSRL